MTKPTDDELHRAYYLRALHDDFWNKRHRAHWLSTALTIPTEELGLFHQFENKPYGEPGPTPHKLAAFELWKRFRTDPLYGEFKASAEASSDDWLADWVRDETEAFEAFKADRAKLTATDKAKQRWQRKG